MLLIRTLEWLRGNRCDELRGICRRAHDALTSVEVDWGKIAEGNAVRVFGSWSRGFALVTGHEARFGEGGIESIAPAGW